jgi:hypothetical protein
LVVKRSKIFRSIQSLGLGFRLILKSALDQKQTFYYAIAMSALPPMADIPSTRSTAELARQRAAVSLSARSLPATTVSCASRSPASVASTASRCANSVSLASSYFASSFALASAAAPTNCIPQCPTLLRAAANTAAQIIGRGAPHSGWEFVGRWNTVENNKTAAKSKNTNVNSAKREGNMLHPQDHILRFSLPRLGGYANIMSL